MTRCVVIRCRRCADQRPHLRPTAIAEATTDGLTVSVAGITREVKPLGRQAWLASRALPRAAVGEPLAMVGDAYLLSCRRCHAQPRLGARTLVDSVFSAARQGLRTLFVDAGGRLWTDC